MKTFPTLMFVMALAATQGCFSQDKSISGQYTTSGYYSGSLLWLNPDLSFRYKYRGHISSDTAAGLYHIEGDTILLKYRYNNYDSLIADFKANNKEVPVDLLLTASRTTDHRPLKLLKKGNKLYYMDVSSGQYKTYMEKGKSKMLYLRRYS
jgi:hypothetical protein